ncbi:hypothetical protein GCM10020367_17930 [Streptomyces sannanensis]|uniref:Uncharacterized protein n=1 Tax=Streptomyces sannanensis TaxID=285536 RepID=A0ABP6S8J8_9ACTN
MGLIDRHVRAAHITFYGPDGTPCTAPFTRTGRAVVPRGQNGGHNRTTGPHPIKPVRCLRTDTPAN